MEIILKKLITRNKSWRNYSYI